MAATSNLVWLILMACCGEDDFKEKISQVPRAKIGFCNVIFGWDVNDQVYDDSKVTGWHTGFPDSLPLLILSTYRTIPWNDNIPLFLADFHQSEELSGCLSREHC